jgi:hypothetical protein
MKRGICALVIASFVSFSASASVQVVAPSFNPASGTYNATVTLAITSQTGGATIYFTSDGSTPTSKSIRYAGPFTLSSSATIRAIAVKSGQVNSPIATAVYTVLNPARTPVISPVGGTYSTAQTVTITDASGVPIYYTTNGTTPTTTSNRYTGPFTVNSTTTVEAMATGSVYTPSPVALASYTIQVPAATPVLSPGPGSYTGSVTVSISSATAGATIRYTTNGSDPSTNLAGFSSPATITLSSTSTLKAKAYKVGMADSGITTGVYTVAVSPPTFSPQASAFVDSASVSISSLTANASIRYTLNGNDPTATTGSPYNGPLTLTTTVTLKARAFKSGLTDSSVVTGVYSKSVASSISQVPSHLNLSTGDTNKSLTVSALPAGLIFLPTFKANTTSNPNSNCAARLSFSSSQGAGSANGAITAGTAGCSGVFSVTSAIGFTAGTSGSEVIVPPQILIQMLYGEAHGQSSPTQMAIGVATRNRFSQPSLFSGVTTYQDAITSHQFAGINTSIINGPSPTIDNAALVFTSRDGVSVANAACFFSPDGAEWKIIQAALKSVTTAPLPKFTSDPQCYPVPTRQYIVKQSVENNANGNGAPAFVFVQARKPTDPTVIQIP